MGSVGGYTSAMCIARSRVLFDGAIRRYLALIIVLVSPVELRAPVLPRAGSSLQEPATVRAIRYWSGPDSTRVSIDLDSPVVFTEARLSNPDRIFFDLKGTVPSSGLAAKTIEVGDAHLQRIRVGRGQEKVLRIVMDLAATGTCDVSRIENPFRIMVEIHPPRSTGSRSAGPVPANTQTPVSPQALPALSRDSKPAIQEPVDRSRKTEPAEATVRPGTQPAALVAASAVTPMPQENALPSLPRQGNPVGSAVWVPADSKMGVAAPLEKSAPARDSAPPPKPADPTSRGDRSLTRILGLKIGRIVLDPGHGGHDTGTVGPDGMTEKDLVLQVARRLRKMLQDNLGAEVFLTRERDEFISLEERTEIANQLQADLFVSIHANSSRSRSTSGVETYFLDFARTESEREVAARENAATAHAYRDLETLVEKIARADKMVESRELAGVVQKNLYGGARQIFPSARNRGVRSAPFIVLIGAKMPSVLTEVAFLSNPRDEKLLKKDSAQQRLAKALFQGIEGYMKALGSEVAQTQYNANR